jgi:serine/threonine protein kinase
MEIGEGAFGKVWKVTDLLTKRTYALKVMQKKKYITKLT